MAGALRAIKYTLWNADQHRPRALWRLTGQAILFASLALIVEILVGLVGISAVVIRRGLSPEELSDPRLVQQFITSNPGVLMLSYLGIAVSLALSIWLAARFLDRRPVADYGFQLGRDWWIDFGFGLLLGAALMAAIFLIELLAGWVSVTGTFVTQRPETGFFPAIAVPLVTFVAVGFYEELFSRGYQLRNLAEGLTWRFISPRAAIVLAVVLSSAVFGAFHAVNPNATVRSTVFIALAGFMLAAGYLMTGELAIPIALHIAWNFFQGNVFGFPVSGTDFTSGTFIAIEQQGPQLWTGGPFGPEAGLLGLAAMALGIALTALWVRWRYGSVRLDLSIAEPPTLNEEVV